jgi:FkbM family methyltransferase
VCWDAYDTVSRSRYARPLEVPLSIGDTAFNLSIVGDHPKAQREYQRLSTSKAVYEPVMVACLTRILGRMSDPTFMDVGAFMGYYAAYVATLLRDARPVYAVESNPRYADAIRQTAKLNGLRQLHVHQAALSDRPSTVQVDAETVVTTPNGSGVQLVSTTLDDLCRREQMAPNVVKIDVHGAEGKVVLGMRDLLAKTIEYLLIEIHPNDFLERYSPGVARNDILDAIEAAGFTTYYVSGHRSVRSDGLHSFLETGAISYRPLDRSTRGLLLFDRHVDIFLLATRRSGIESILGPPAAAAE